MTRKLLSNRAIRRFRPLITALPIVIAAALGSSAAAEPLVVQGSTTFNRRIMEPFQAQIEEASGQKLTVLPNKSTPGLIGLIEGRAQLAMISAPLETEIEALRKMMPGVKCDQLHEFRVSASQVALGVHQSNPVRRISIQTLTKILLGEITNWREIGGADRPIRVVLVGGGGGLTVAVVSLLLNGQSVGAPDVIYVKTPVQLVQVTEQEPGALGFAQLALTKQRGIPTLATERPIEQTLSLVTLGEPTPAMKSVIDATRLIVKKTML
jgi:phosphate transport system substrate-binding protein